MDCTVAMADEGFVYDLEVLHAHIVRLSQAKTADIVVDLGCGTGSTLVPLLNQVCPGGLVVGVDIDQSVLIQARRRCESQVSREQIAQLLLVQADLEERLPLGEHLVDVVVCQDVLESIRGRDALIEECRRILKPRGRCLIGHHDFDSILVNGRNREITRAFVHAFADSPPDQPDGADGWLGRRLKTYAHRSNFKRAALVTLAFSDVWGQRECLARRYIEMIASSARRRGFRERDVDGWVGELEAGAAAGEFYFAVACMFARLEMCDGNS